MKKLILVMVAIVALTSCKSSKSSCEAYGHRVKMTSTTKQVRR